MSYHKRKKGAGAWQILYDDMKHVLVGTLCLIVILLLIVAVVRHRMPASVRTVTEISEESIEAHTPDYEVNLLTVNEYSRPGIALEEVNGIVIHYTANPGTSAEANRDYFEGLKDSHATKASAHFIVGLEGEIVQCIPTAEIAYASNDRNSDTLSIECCYENEDGSFNQATYDSVIHLTAWLCAKFGLTSDDVMRHYDITGKLCPVYYVENPDAWEQFLADVDAYLASM
ncbi:MAG: N-acetylmuramoyl-L-alanine amidase [Lachnospiraceae bacterium]|nr:N-acetylmuramoyl-L-alanine amidase [Lachnospiraceae bacterium]